MSVKATARVLETVYGSQLRKLLMLILADYAGEDGTSYPGIETIAARAECGVRTVQENLRGLAKDGHLHIAYNASPYRTNLYTLLFPKKPAPQTPQQPHPAPAAPPRMSDAQTAPDGADDRRPSAPEPSGTVRNHQEREPQGTPSPRSIATADNEAAAEETNRILQNLTRAYPNALPDLSHGEKQKFLRALPLLRSLQPDDFLALHAWTIAPQRIRGRSQWPRTRAEFLTAPDDALEQVRLWWRTPSTGGRKWYLDRHGPKPTTAAPPAGHTSLVLTSDGHTEALTAEESLAILRSSNS